MGASNGATQYIKNFLNVRQHDPFVLHKSSIKIYRSIIKPNTNKIATNQPVQIPVSTY